MVLDAFPAVVGCDLLWQNLTEVAESSGEREILQSDPLLLLEQTLDFSPRAQQFREK